MGYKIVNDDSLTSVANAIRVQGGFSATLEFPDGFVSAIQNLSPSGGNDFIVTLSWDTQANEFVCDKTYSEVYAAYQAGKNLVSTVDTTDFPWGLVTSVMWFDSDSNTFDFALTWVDDEGVFGHGKQQLYLLDTIEFHLAADYDMLSRIQFESPSRTYTPTTSTQTETITYDASDDFNGIEEVDITVNPIPSQYKDTTDATATASEILSGYTAYANGQKLVGTASGGITPSGTYSITSNGIYDIVSFASVDVNVSGGGGGDHDAEDAIIGRTISGAYTNSRVENIGSNAFQSCTNLAAVSFPNVSILSSNAFLGCINLVTANFPNATSIGYAAFSGCSKLASVSFPNAISIGEYAFQTCSSLAVANFPNVTSIALGAFRSCASLTTASFPKATHISTSAFLGCINLVTANFPNVTSIGNTAFRSCASLTTASFPKAIIVGSSAFSGCTMLMSVYFLNSSVASLSNAFAFNSTPMSNSTYTGSFGSIYVPASLVDTYKSRANWSVYSARITAYEE